MTDITELAQSHELLIANGQQTADLLRHLADNEIDSDYFAVVSECESYGKETDAELSITEFALRAAGYVDALVEALEKAQAKNALVAGGIEATAKLHERIAELEEAEQKLCAANVTLDARAELAERQLAEMVSRTVTVKPMRSGHIAVGGEKIGIYMRDEVDEFIASLAAAGIKLETE